MRLSFIIGGATGRLLLAVRNEMDPACFNLPRPSRLEPGPSQPPPPAPAISLPPLPLAALCCTNTCCNYESILIVCDILILVEQADKSGRILRESRRRRWISTCIKRVIRTSLYQLTYLCIARSNASYYRFSSMFNVCCTQSF